MTLPRLLAFLILFFSWGCATRPAGLARYSAVVESVECEDPLILQEYSLSGGRQPLTVIHLKLLTRRGSGEPGELKVVALGLHRPDEFGQAGSWVTFLLAGPIPRSGEVPLEQLVDYRIVHATQFARSPDSHGAPSWIASAAADR